MEEGRLLGFLLNSLLSLLFLLLLHHFDIGFRVHEPSYLIVFGRHGDGGMGLFMIFLFI
jgi:hypothetical protein